jgi:excisionase family DNA binding protein
MRLREGMEKQRATSKAERTRSSKDEAGAVTRLIGVSDLAAILNVHERHIYRLVAERRIPYIKWGHLLRFDAHDVQRWLDGNRIEPLPPTRRDAAPAGSGGQS